MPIYELTYAEPVLLRQRMLVEADTAEDAANGRCDPIEILETDGGILIGEPIGEGDVIERPNIRAGRAA